MPPALKDVVSEKRRLESRRPVHAYPAGLRGGGDCGEAAFLPPALKDVVSDFYENGGRKAATPYMPIPQDCGEAGLLLVFGVEVEGVV